jgi:hypothetical protein
MDNYSAKVRGPLAGSRAQSGVIRTILVLACLWNPLRLPHLPPAFASPKAKNSNLPYPCSGPVARARPG